MGTSYPGSFIGVGGATCRNPWANANTGGGWAFWYQSKFGGASPPWPGYGGIKFAFARDTGTHLDAQPVHRRRFHDRYLEGCGHR